MVPAEEWVSAIDSANAKWYALGEKLFGVMEMTIQEIEKYIKTHDYLVFKYQSEYYSLVKKYSLLGASYCLIATDGGQQQRNSLEALCGQARISGTLLGEAIKQAEIPEADDPAWQTYEAIRHCAIVHGSEIHFFYHQREYWIAHAPEGFSHLSDDLGNTQMFSSCSDLFERARIEGKPLKEIWEDVMIDAY